MKIIQIMPEFGLAGAERMCETLVLELKEKHDISVISLYDYHSAITDNLEEHGVKIFYCGKKSGLDMSMVRKLYVIFKSERPDVIHTHRYVMEYVIPAAILAGIKGRVHTIHNMADKEVKRKLQLLQYIFFKYCNVIPVSISPIVKQSVIDVYKMEAAKVPMIFNGINMNRIYKKTRYDFFENMVFIHVGRYSEQKNHAEILQAFYTLHSEFRNTRLLLVGEGELRAKITNLIAKLKLDDCVQQLGVRNDVMRLYSQADCFILPSKYEGMPVTLIEAMATGMPIIVSSVGGVPDMVEHGRNALLCSSKADDIAEKMREMYLDKEMREKLGRNAKIDSSKFSSKTMANEYQNIYLNFKGRQ